MKSLILCTMLLFTNLAFAELAIVVHPSNDSNFDESVINRIYTGKEKSFSNGNKVIPLSQEANSAVTEEFNSKVLSKTSSQLKAYWSKLIFTGKGTPPKELESDAEVIKMVAANPDTIGFVSAAAVSDNVKVVLTF
ncbi:phosphate ABC transporter substrate-binding protein [Pseudoalteromonas mariniglutinosa]|uniref:phosphate ABC transporter substrate-binding protein n=1 Tax=Pseudoalteromonas mariniglutinosa TaxID=206042 RepID=UPI00385124B4